MQLLREKNCFFNRGNSKPVGDVCGDRLSGGLLQLVL